MPSVIEVDDEIIWGVEARCPECGGDHESFTAGMVDGGLEVCDDCFDRQEALDEATLEEMK